MIGISPQKVVHIILKAREYDAKVASWEDGAGDLGHEDEPEAILEDMSNDGTRKELEEFISSLNVDEQESLVALTWIGRGTYSPRNFDKALATARREHVNETREYLLGTPLLAEYLEEGLSQMGYDVEQLEAELLS